MSRERTDKTERFKVSDHVAWKDAGCGVGNAAAEMLWQDGYSGRITMLSAGGALPCDRPKLSKGYLAGVSDEAATPLRSPELYREHDIALRLGTRVTHLHTAGRQVQLASGSRPRFGASA